MRRTALKRTRTKRELEPGEAEWKRRRSGYCAICTTRGPLILHHVVDKNRVRRETTAEQQAAGIVWDQRNALAVGAPFIFGGRCRCHENHHGPGRIPYTRIPSSAVKFAREILGPGPALEYFRRYYLDAP